MIKLTKQNVKKVIRLKSLFSLLFILALSFTTVFGQGTVKGTITDKADNMPLIAVHIIVKGTTTGTVTNYNGEYILPLKAGTYTLQISYMGYETVEETITIEDNQIIELNKELTGISFMGEEVVVTMQARGQLSAVNQQLRSNQIINVVSAERIRELPDENAAQAISRLPGVHLDGSKVVIRGLEPKMNKIMVNGIALPSVSMPTVSDALVGGNVASVARGTEGLNTRSTDLSVISANVLSGIEVFKTLTPDMDADAVGGVVNLRFREAPRGLHYSITAQGNYNQLNQMYGGTKFWGNVSNRFLNDDLGAILNLNYETKYGGDDWMRLGYNERGSTSIPGEGVYMLASLNLFDQLKTTETLGGSLVLDYDLPNGQLLFTSMLSSTTPEETNYRESLEIWRFYHWVFLNKSKYNTLLSNNSLRLEQQLGIVKLDAGVSYASIDSKSDFRYESRFQETGEDAFFLDSITEPRKLSMQPWEIYDWINPNGDSTGTYDLTQAIPTDYDEQQWMADINMQIPLRISDNIDVNFRLGGKYVRKDRNYDEQQLYDYYTHVVRAVKLDMLDWLVEKDIVEDVDDPLYVYKFLDYDYDQGDNYMNSDGQYYMDWIYDTDLMDEFWLEHVDQNRETTHLATDSRDAWNDYWGWESLTAGYAMAEINLGKKLTIIPGVRFEQVHNEYSAYKVSQNTMDIWQIRDTLTKPADHDHLLPHLHIRFKATDWWDIRFSYNNTLSRPDYYHSIPVVYYHEISGGARAGNPNIKPAVSENLDANFTFYSPKMGLVTIGGYMKRINDIFYLQPTLLKNLPDSNIINEFPIETYPSLLQSTQDFYINSPYTAYVKGMELEWQSNFSWLPVPFNGIVLNANYTHVWSETKYMQDRLRYERVPGSFLPQPVEVDTFYVNRLLHQANDIANFSVGYDYKGLSARLSFRFQGNVISNIDTRPEENEYTKNIYAYDFVIKQNIPLKFGEFEVFLNAINFTNVPRARYSTFKRPDGTDRDATTYERYSGRQFQLGLRFKY